MIRLTVSNNKCITGNKKSIDLYFEASNEGVAKLKESIALFLEQQFDISTEYED